MFDFYGVCQTRIGIIKGIFFMEIYVTLSPQFSIKQYIKGQSAQVIGDLNLKSVIRIITSYKWWL